MKVIHMIDVCFRIGLDVTNQQL